MSKSQGDALKALEAVIIDQLSLAIFAPLEFLANLVIELDIGRNPDKVVDQQKEAHFDSQFALGACGLHTVVDVLLTISSFIPESVTLSISDRVNVYTQIDFVAQASLSLLRHLRFKTPRSLWTPHGSIRRFMKVYEVSRSVLRVSITFLSRV